MVKEIRDQAIQEAKEELRKDVPRDKVVVRAVKYLEKVSSDLDEEIQVFRDWYGIHFPEFVEQIQDNDHFLKLLSNGLERTDVNGFESLAKESTGSMLVDEDLEALEVAFEDLKDKYQMREELESYIEEVVEDEMGNLTAFMEPMLVAKLLAHAGSLETLAKKPASTVQMYGAEKALFRYLKGEGTPPKHGVIYEHRFVNSLPEEKRGKMSRFMANKISIAARLDYYGGDFKGDELREEITGKYHSLEEDN
jgi:nucleolar protein 56